MASVIVYQESGRPMSTWSGMSTPYKKKPLPPIELRKDPKHGLWVWNRPKVTKPAKPGSFWMGSNLRAGRLWTPGAHDLVKSLGDFVNISWDVTNTGDTPGIARLWLFAVGQGGLVKETPQRFIGPGETASLPLDWLVNLPVGTHTMLLIMADQSPGATDSVAEHQFNITVLADPVNLTRISTNIFILKPGGFYTWNGTVRNDEPIGGRSGFFRLARSETSSFGGPHIRRLTGSQINPGETETDSANVSTGATFSRGELWVEEWTDSVGNGGTLVRELPGARVPYSFVF